MAYPLRFPYGKEVKLALLLALLLFATSTWASDDDKQKRRIPIVGGLLDKVQKKMAKTTTVTIPEESNVEEPVCSADGDGDAKCQDSADKSDIVDTTSDVVADAAANTEEEDDEKPQIIKVGSDGVLHLREQPPDNSANIFTCKDRYEQCEEYSQYNLGPGKDTCMVNSAYMTHYCPLTCNTCDVMYLGHRMSTTMLEGELAITPFCQDNAFECKHFAEMGECEKNPTQVQCRYREFSLLPLCVHYDV